MLDESLDWSSIPSNILKCNLESLMVNLRTLQTPTLASSAPLNFISPFFVEMYNGEPFSLSNVTAFPKKKQCKKYRVVQIKCSSKYGYMKKRSHNFINIFLVYKWL